MNIRLKPKPKVTGLPRDMQIEYFGKIDKEKFFVIWRPKKNNWGYKDFLLRVGSADKLKSVKIKKVERLPDGGSTFFYTTIGKFFFAPWGEHEGDFKGKSFSKFYYSAYDDIYNIGSNPSKISIPPVSKKIL